MLKQSSVFIQISHEFQNENTKEKISEEFLENENIENVEKIYKSEVEEYDELEEKKYSILISIAYILMAIISESPYFIIVSLSSYFKKHFNVVDVMINEFSIMESLSVTFSCVLLHTIGSYRLKWNLYQPLLTVFIIFLINLVVYFKHDYIGHKIIIFSSIPLGIVLSIAKMTTIKICALYKKSYCTAYICGLSLSGFLVFILYVVSGYILFKDDENIFFNILILLNGVISFLAIICFLMLYKIYNLPFIKRLKEKYDDKGFYLRKTIFYDSFHSINALWKYTSLGFLTNFLTYLIYPSIFPTIINIDEKSKGLLSGMILFGDSLARLIVHNLSSYFIKISIFSYSIFKASRFLMIPIFVFIHLYEHSILINIFFLNILAFILGFTNGIINNAIFLKLSEYCKKKTKIQYAHLASNIVYIFFLVGCVVGCLSSKIYIKFN